MRVFLDTNVLVSAFAARGLSADLFQLVLIEHEFITGSAVLAELERALRRKLRLPPVRCAEILEFVRAEAEAVISDAPAAKCDADPDDQAVLGEALAGEAEAFVAGDAELVALGTLQDTGIRTPRQLWELLRSK